MTARRGERRRAIRGGIVGGILGGVALSALLIVMTTAAGQPPWPVLKGAATPFIGERAQTPEFALGPVLLGVGVHLLVSIAWGVLFGLMAHGLRRGPTLGFGLIWGIIVWLGMYYLVLPLVGLGAIATTTPVGIAILSHVLFGLFVAIGFLPYQRPRPPSQTRVQRSTRGGRDLEERPDRNVHP